MKPKLINNWIVTLAAFRPDESPDTEWSILNPQERADRCKFSPYRIRIEMVYGYNQAAIEGCTTLRFGDADSITVTGTVEEFDKIFMPHTPMGQN